MRRIITIDDFGGVVTNADLADLPDSAMSVLKNLRPVNGKLVKTFGLGDVADVCAIDLSGTDWEVYNAFTFIDSNFSEGYRHVLVVTHDTTYETVVLFWEPANYTGGADAGTIFLSWAADSYWVKGPSNFIDDSGKIFIGNTVYTDENSLVYTFPTSYTACNNLHAVGVQGLTTQYSAVYNSVPSDLGVEYNLEYWTNGSLTVGKKYTISTYAGSDDFTNVGAASNATGVSFVATGTTPTTWNDSTLSSECATIDSGFKGAVTFHGMVKEWETPAGGSPLYDTVRCAMFWKEHAYVSLYNKVTGPETYDKLTWYDAVWDDLDESAATPNGLGITVDTSDVLTIYGIYEFNSNMYLAVRFYDSSATTTYLKIFKVTNTGTDPDNNVYSEIYSDNTGATLTSAVGGVTSEHRVSGCEWDSKLWIYIAPTATANNSLSGLLLSIQTDDTVTSETLPTPTGGSIEREEVQIGTDETYLFLAYNDTASSTAHLWSIASGGSWSEITLPDTITNMTIADPWSWESIEHLYGGYSGDTPVIGIAAGLDDSSVTTWQVIVYSAPKATWQAIGDVDRSYSEPTDYEISDLYFSDSDYTGRSFWIGFRNLAGSAASVVIKVNSASLSTDISASSSSGKVAANCIATDAGAASNHLLAVQTIIGTKDLAGLGTESALIYRDVSIGANPDYAEYEAGFEFDITTTACIGWRDVESLYTAANLPVYHKQDRNPMIADESKLRVFPGNVGTVASQEAKGLWLGYIDRDYFDEQWTPADTYDDGASIPGFYANIAHDTAPTTALTVSSTVTGSDNYFVRYCFIYDGVNVGELSPVTSLTSATSGAAFVYTIALSKAAYNRRITGMRIYKMSSGLSDATSELIVELDFTRKDTFDNRISSTGITDAAYAESLTADPDDYDYVGKTVDIGGNTTVIATAVRLSATEAVFTFDGTGTLQAAVWETAASIGAYAGDLSGEINLSGATSSLVDSDPSVDFTQWGLEGLTGIGDANLSGINTSTLRTISSVKRNVIDFDDNVGSDDASIRYALGVHPWVVTISGDTVTIRGLCQIDEAQGDSYDYAGEEYFKINGQYAKKVKSRLFLGDIVLDPGGKEEAHPDWIAYTEINQYDVFPASNVIRLPDREGGAITGLAGMFDSLVVFKTQAIFVLDVSNSGSTLTWSIREAKANIGNIAPEGLVNSGGSVFFCYYDGIYRMDSNLDAEATASPSLRNKISYPIEDTYSAISDKTAIKAEFNQNRGEVVFNFGTTVWAYHVEFDQWRQIDTDADLDIITLGSTAELLAFDSSDGKMKSMDVSESVTAEMRTKEFRIAFERPELIRYVWVQNGLLQNTNSDTMTVNVYLDGSGTASVTKVVPASTASYKVPVQRRARSFQVGISWATSVYGITVNKMEIEVD